MQNKGTKMVGDIRLSGEPLKGFQQKSKAPIANRESKFVSPSCGAAGNRTRVQTRNKRAFYMLIQSLIVGRSTGTDTQTQPYLLKSRRLTGE